jgi:hypothetical protein
MDADGKSCHEKHSAISVFKIDKSSLCDKITTDLNIVPQNFRNSTNNSQQLSLVFHMSEATGKGLLLKADPIAAAFRDEVKASLAQRSRPPKLVGILATSSAPSKSYAEFTKRQCEDLGVEFVLRKIGAAVSNDLSEGEGVEEAIIEANEDVSVQGIMVCIVVPL